MFTEKVRMEIQRRPGIVAALIICFVLGLTMHGVGYVMVRNAEASIEATQVLVANTVNTLEVLETRLKIARTVHRAEYLKSFEVASLTQTVGSAKEKLTTAKAVSNPDSKEVDTILSNLKANKNIFTDTATSNPDKLPVKETE